MATPALVRSVPPARSDETWHGLTVIPAASAAHAASTPSLNAASALRARAGESRQPERHRIGGAAQLRMDHCLTARLRQLRDHARLARDHHLLDPATAEPHRAAARSLTVAAADCLTADAAATMLFGAAPSLAGEILPRTPGARIVHST